jgi:hypothetical protein
MIKEALGCMMNIYPQKMPAREWDFGPREEGRRVAFYDISSVFSRSLLGVQAVCTKEAAEH